MEDSEISDFVSKAELLLTEYLMHSFARLICSNTNYKLVRHHKV